MKYREVFNSALSKGYEMEHCYEFEDTLQLQHDYYKGTNSVFIELCLIQKWLRDEKKFHIYIDTTPTFAKIQGSKWRASIKVPFQPFRWTTGRYYLGDTYEEALLIGIEQVLTLI